ncbi:hypothetical protein [Paenibacillus lutrae]|uniref:Uncharacterized protein n=1 Tax=Paenibacillus lutrae TaxID=2078573 RepID=A0A7X3K205_9BACL|nr:hypothetical protein [Paenibacillus lutrae]MVP02466.1 hypothetical protein [Paenibacillus lutrae]
MINMEKPAIEREELAKAWMEQLPRTLPESDHARVWPDEADPQAIRIHITNAGRSSYTFDFKCTYVDSREVRVELVDVERDDVHVDETTDIIQNLVGDYIRHIHECAQTLQDLTHV